MNFFIRNSIALLWAFFVACCSSPVTPAPEEGETTAKELTILAIGNSFSADAVDQNLFDLFDAAGYTVVIGNLYATGSSLEDHWNRASTQAEVYSYSKNVHGKKSSRENVALDQVLAEEEWTVVTLQQASSGSDKYETYLPFAKDLKQYVEARTDAKIYWHQTWSYANSAFENEVDRTQQSMYESIAANSRRIVEELGFAGVIPSGTAVQNARAKAGDVFNRDYLHLEMDYGRYLAACTWFETLSGESVVGNAWRPDNVTPEMADLCRKAAHDAFIHPYEVTR